MARTIIALLAVLFSGCASMPNQMAYEDERQHINWPLVGTVALAIAISVVVASDDSNDPVHRERKVCRVTGSVVICDFE
jgi:hypothetical protein